MKNIIEAVSLKKFMEHIEEGISFLQDQDLPVNPYSFSFIVSELNKYIEELDHPRYIPFICGTIENEVMNVSVQISDRFNQDSWIGNIKFSYPRSDEAVTPAKPKSSTIVPVPRIDVFDSEIKTGSRKRKCAKDVNTDFHRKRIGLKFNSYTEYVNYVAAIFDELAGCTDCLNKTLIDAFIGRFAYPKAFVSSGTVIRQHLKLRDDIELDDRMKAGFKIDWPYFFNKWEDNAISIAQYKSADAKLTYKGRHTCIDLIEKRVGKRTFELTDLGKVIWEKVRDFLGLVNEGENDQPTESNGIEVMPTPAAVAARLGTEEQLENHVEEKVEEAAKVRHMGYNKCNGCTYFDKAKQWCDKRQDYITSLEHDECFEKERPELEVAKREEVERICYNCKRWHSGNNPGGLKAIACRCPVQGRKTLTDHTCNKFVAIVRKED